MIQICDCLNFLSELKHCTLNQKVVGKVPSSTKIPGELLATMSLPSDDWGYSLSSDPKLALGMALEQSNDWQKNIFLKLVEFILKKYILIFSKKTYSTYDIW